MKITYCMECAEKYTNFDDTNYACPKGHRFWNNPQATVGVALYNDKGEILYSKRADEPAKGKYDLPGSFLEFNEDPFVAAKREITEESGMTIDDLELVTAYAGLYEENNSVCDLIIVAHKRVGQPVPNDDSEALEWKPLEFMDDPQFNPNIPAWATSYARS